MGFGLITCGGVEDVVSVLPRSSRSGAGLPCPRVEELREQLEVEEEDGDRQEEEEEVTLLCMLSCLLVYASFQFFLVML